MKVTRLHDNFIVAIGRILQLNFQKGNYPAKFPPISSNCYAQLPKSWTVLDESRPLQISASWRVFATAGQRSGSKTRAQLFTGILGEMRNEKRSIDKWRVGIKDKCEDPRISRSITFAVSVNPSVTVAASTQQRISSQRQSTISTWPETAFAFQASAQTIKMPDERRSAFGRSHGMLRPVRTVT